MRRSRGDIWFVDLTDARGHEQSGLRPAVVLAVAYGGMIIVVPLTTAPAALVFQIVALSEDRFVRKIGRCSVEDMEAISVLLKGLLALE